MFNPIQLLIIVINLSSILILFDIIRNMMYLNTIDEEVGGATSFYEHGIKLQPKKGTLVVF